MKYEKRILLYPIIIFEAAMISPSFQKDTAMSRSNYKTQEHQLNPASHINKDDWPLKSPYTNPMDDMIR